MSGRRPETISSGASIANGGVWFKTTTAGSPRFAHDDGSPRHCIARPEPMGNPTAAHRSQTAVSDSTATAGSPRFARDDGSTPSLREGPEPTGQSAAARRSQTAVSDSTAATGSPRFARDDLHHPVIAEETAGRQNNPAAAHRRKRRCLIQPPPLDRALLLAMIWPPSLRGGRRPTGNPAAAHRSQTAVSDSTAAPWIAARALAMTAPPRHLVRRP